MSQTEPVITRTPSHVNGVPVIAIEQALAPHPHPRFNGKMVPFRGVYKVLLEDGTETYLCAGTEQAPCDKTDSNPKAIASHRAGLHPKAPRAKSLYPEATLRRVLTEVAKARRAGLRGHIDRATEAMNISGIKPLSGSAWTRGMISSITYAHGDRIKVRVPAERPATATQRAAARVRAAAAGGVLNGQVTVLEDTDVDVLRQFVVILPRLGQALTRVADFIEAGAAQNEAIADKARRYDELQALLNGRVVG